jgi:hypothetical protein
LDSRLRSASIRRPNIAVSRITSPRESAIRMAARHNWSCSLAVRKLALSPSMSGMGWYVFMSGQTCGLPDMTQVKIRKGTVIRRRQPP